MVASTKTSADDKLAKDHPIVEQLIKLDDDYRKIEDEYQREWNKLAEKYSLQQKPLIQQRQELVKKALLLLFHWPSLKNDTSPPEQNLKGFWMNVLLSHPLFADTIQEWDRPVLEHLEDIRIENLDCKQGMNRAGFKVHFEFSENEWFSHTTLTRVYKTKLESEFMNELTPESITMEEGLEWKTGKDITVTFKKPKNKKKNNKPVKEIRDSFFSLFFRTINNEDPESMRDLLDRTLRDLDQDLDECEEDELEGMYEEALEKVNDDAYEMGMCLRDQLVPFAVRWYTGEAFPDDGESEDEEDEDEEDPEEEDDDDEIETGEGGKKKDIFKSGGEKPDLGGKQGNTEECKQQ